MTTPVVVDVTASVFDADTTSHAVAMPATANAGELLLCIFANDDVTGVTTPAGWTLIGAQSGAAGTSSCRVYAKSAAGTEGGTTVDFVTAGAEVAVAQVYRITGWNGGNPPTTSDIAIATVTGASSVNADPPSLTPTWGSDTNLWIAIANLDNRSSGANTPPTNYTNMVYTEAPLAVNRTCVFSAVRALTAATENPGTYTTAAAQAWVGVTIAIRPAPTVPMDNRVAQIMPPVSLLDGPWTPETPLMWDGGGDTTIPNGVTPITDADAAAFTEAVATLIVMVAVGDVAAATEATAILVTLAGADTAAATEASAIMAALTAADGATATEAVASLVAIITGADTATATEAAVLIVALAANDPAAATDVVAALVVSVGPADTTTATEAATVMAILSGADALTATEGAVVTILTIVAAADTVGATEASSTMAGLTGADTAAGSDAAAATAVTTSSADAAAATEGGTIAGTVTAADTVTATEDASVATGAPVIPITAADTITATDDVVAIVGAAAPTVIEQHGDIGGGRWPRYDLVRRSVVTAADRVAVTETAWVTVVGRAFTAADRIRATESAAVARTTSPDLTAAALLLLVDHEFND